jgi:hypothetical protein
MLPKPERKAEAVRHALPELVKFDAGTFSG